MNIIKILKSKTFTGLLAHAVLLQLSLSFAYNSYKEFERGTAPLTGPMKSAIKGTFPLAVLLFSVIYFIFSRRRKKGEGIILTPARYLAAIGIYVIVMNSIFASRGLNVIIPLNITVIYFAVFLVIVRLAGRFDMTGFNMKYPDLEDWTPPVLYRLLIRERGLDLGFLKNRPAHFLIVTFTVLFLFSVLLLLFGMDGGAESVADIAFLVLLIALLVELYRVVRYGTTEEE
ncbi:MAG: hypothetical protein BMS9Abin23_0443 [Thermodesulfobacteriota bacterium]|nr:MAG: hypothetical protein BMS9Abin23_0443 [Thermodesulfobacteriota bacterium]